MNEQSYNILNDFPPEKFNLLIPVQSIQEINPIYKLVVNTVKITPNIVEEKGERYTKYTDLNKEVYNEKNAQGEACWALTHRALMKLFTAANGQIVDSSRVRSKICDKCIDIVKATGKAPQCGSCAANANVACRIIVKFPELSGGWRLVQATRELDFSNMGNATENQIRQTKAFAYEHAESKALSRCIRKGLSIKSAYSLAELEKPFIVIYPVLDARDADVKKALIAGAIASSNLLYGSGLMLGAGQQALPEGRNDVDMSTGQVIDQDYEAEQPDNTEQSKPWDTGEAEKYNCSNPKCKAEIAKSVYDSSVAEFGYAACIKCGQELRKAGKAK
jgi:hypothetical protein